MKNRQSRPVTLHDVANRAGVSYQTVSRVINNHPDVAQETRARIMQLVTEMGYQPNKTARSLVSRRSNTIAVVTYSIAAYGPTQILVSIEKNARSAGYDLILSNITDLTQDSLNTAINGLNRWQVDGILIFTPVDSNQYASAMAVAAGTPIVQIDAFPGAPVPSVVIDQHSGSQQATQYLIALGHRHICEISGPRQWYSAAMRHQGWRDTMRAHGLDATRSIEGDWTSASGYQAAHTLLAQAPFTALVSANDQMALGAMRALRECGLRVPEDVSITGFDDIPDAAFFEPPLTTVRQDFDALGQRGLEYLIERIQQPNTPIEQRVLPVTFIPRATTAPASGL